jgi:hypothetical protein
MTSDSNVAHESEEASPPRMRRRLPCPSIKGLPSLLCLAETERRRCVSDHPGPPRTCCILL